MMKKILIPTLATLFLGLYCSKNFYLEEYAKERSKKDLEYQSTTPTTLPTSQPSTMPSTRPYPNSNINPHYKK